MSTTANTNAALLIVDDDADTCANLTDIFSDMGFHVTATQDAYRAIELVEKSTFDVALLDLKMPGMDGISLFRRIKEISSHTVAIIISAYTSPGTKDEALAAGAWQVLSKPIDVEKLFPLLSEVLDQPLVLVVDDDRDLCENLWDLLRDKGYRVSLAHSENQVKDFLQKRDFQIVLIDMKMPETTGNQIFQIVQSNSPSTRTILITGLRSEMEEMINKILHEGADTVCYKPFNVPELLDVVTRLTDRKKPFAQA